jgi:hypothetical protein
MKLGSSNQCCTGIGEALTCEYGKAYDHVMPIEPGMIHSAYLGFTCIVPNKMQFLT